ncbi:MAG: glutamate racemase [Bdellovibrionales bacterium]|nr:glutamate racemase [Bdellovibrionales bacterium]
MSERPIGVFDSGLGGLTVLKALRENFPHENFIYLGDTARIPYGTKSPRTISKYLEQNVNFLKTKNVKAVVVACNSASSVVHAITSDIPIYNVIEPGARAAARATQNNLIGIIATRATVAGRNYVTRLEEINPEFKIYQQACPLLVPLVEEGWDDDPITNLIIYRYLSPLMAVKIDTLIMGCTHYPILKEAIRKVVGPNVELIDSGASVSEKIESDFQKNILAPNHSGLTGDISFMITDTSESFQAQAQRIMAPMPVKKLELVDVF